MKDELIGRRVIIKHKDNQPEIKGVILDETKNTFIVQVNGKDKTIPKLDRVWCFDQRCIEGKDLQGRPEERLKK